MQWLPISEFTLVDFTTGHTFLLFNALWVSEFMPHGVTVGYPSDSGSGVAPFDWAIAAVDVEGQYTHVDAPQQIELPTHFARMVPAVPVEVGVEVD